MNYFFLFRIDKKENGNENYTVGNISANTILIWVSIIITFVLAIIALLKQQPRCTDSSSSGGDKCNCDYNQIADYLMNEKNFMQNYTEIKPSKISLQNSEDDKDNVYAFSMTKETLKYLIDKEIFTMQLYTKDKYSTVQHREIRMSTEILKNNWNIGCLIPMYDNVDFLSLYNKKIEYVDYKIPLVGDIMATEYENKYWNRYDLVIVKANRLKSISYNVNRISSICACGR